MSKNIRQKISDAIRTIFRSSSNKSKMKFCCSVKKPNDYEYISYHSKQTSTKQDDYIDLSECYSKDSGISSNELESTRIFPDDSFSLSTFSNLSPIPYDQNNITHSDMNTYDSSFKSCQCHCHQYVNNEFLLNQANYYLYTSEQYQQKLTKNKIYPFIL